ncbi:MAG: hypothetical protein Q8N63_07045 [Nanoarchaeota archaeon]|nr:hypothetical protein [Nanoarchaeota archaeon]
MKKEDKRRIANKRGMTHAKAYFLIVNIVIATIAFSWMVGAQTEKELLDEGYKYLSGNQYISPEGDIFTLQSTTSMPTAVKAVGLAAQPVTFSATTFTTTAGEKIADSALLNSAGDYDLFLAGKDLGVTASPETLFEAGIKVPVEAPNIGPNWLKGVGDFFNGGIIQSAMYIGIWAGIGYMIGGFIGGNADIAGAWAGGLGSAVYQIMAHPANFGLVGKTSVAATKGFTFLSAGPLFWGVAVAAVIFIAMYRKQSIELVEFKCQPWEAPTGGADCELCNEIENGCSEYRCKSLGQACDLVNKGTLDEKCVWINPRDVNSPLIKIGSLLKGYIWKPDTAVRPPATGVVISKEDGGCVEAFTPLEFTILTDEPAQCKIDYNLTRGYKEMNYYVGGSNIFSYNHTEKMSLPGPNAINKIAPELKNDGTYTLYVRCIDANGNPKQTSNFNQDAFSVRFCVNPGPDTTAPRIEAVSIPSNSPIQYNKTSLDIEVYVNEPSECKWSKEDRSFDNMENSMACSTNVWEMNNNNVYTCKTTLTGIKDREENNFYFRCKDQPGAEEGDRNVNTQSYKYTIIGTQPLNILKVGPNETIRGSTDTVPVELYVKTDNGYKNGEAICYYSTTENEKDYIQFLYDGTKITNEHRQRQDLVTGSYKYYFKCVDLGGNAAYNSTSFNVEVDRSPPAVVRAYREGGLKIITSEDSICSYSNKDCNFEIKDGIAMPYDNQEVHTAEWKLLNYYIRCKDDYDNQPNPNTCSIVVKPYNLAENVLEL